MNFILVQRPSFSDGALAKLRESYPSSSQLTLTSDNFKEVVTRIKVPSKYTEKWLIFAYTRGLSYDNIIHLATLDDIVIFIVRSEDDALDLALPMSKESIEFSYLNDSKPSKEEILNFILKNLNITPKLAEYMANRANWKVDVIQTSTLAMENIKKIKKSDINYFTPLAPSASMDDVIEYILGYREVKGKSSIYSVVERYSYSAKFLFDFTDQRLSLMMWLHEKILLGELTLKTYKEFRREYSKEIREFGKYSSLTDYRLFRIVAEFEFVSYEKLYYFRSLIRDAYIKNPSTLSYLNILRIGGL